MASFENISWISVADALLQKSLLQVHKTPFQTLSDNEVDNDILEIIHSIKYGLNCVRFWRKYLENKIIK